MIPVTKTFLPPQEEYNALVERIWKNQWLTNRGELVKELEQKLKDYLNVEHIILTANGTLPLQIALKALGITGEVITTPFSYVATTAVIVWEGCTPVFVDIDPEHLTIDETKIEAAITPRTQAILATHVYGNPCNVEVIDEIAKKHNLKVIYDAAHCFGVTYKGKSIFTYGDVSTCSFHATKIFHTAEGGAMFCNDEKLYQKLYYHHNFGHEGKEDFKCLGTNAKMSELQAAMGLAVLPYFEQVRTERKIAIETYKEELSNLPVKLLKVREETHWNYSYLPIVFQTSQILLQVVSALKSNSIFARRYFFPSLNTLPYLEVRDMPNSDCISERILCLPVFHAMGEESVRKVLDIIDNELQ